MTENEYKALINKDQYYRLCSVMKKENGYDCRDVLQKNYYYDTYTLKYDRRNITIRIRDKIGRLEGCIKTHNAVNGTKNIETRFQVETVPDSFYYKDDLVYQHGASETLRKEILLSPEIEVDIDKTVYLDKTDYEVEVEFKEGADVEAKKVFELICDFVNCQKEEESVKNKSQRFFEKWREIYLRI